MSGLFTSLAVMMSPRGLAVAGTGAGTGGLAFIAVLVLAAVASLSTARSMENLSTGRIRATPFDSFTFGLLDAARLFTLPVLAVSWLGIAGYAVNEIFFLWFPNLAASFLILIMAVIACIVSEDNRMNTFTLSLTLAFSAFVYIALMATQPVGAGIGYPTVIPPLFTPIVPESMTQGDPLVWLHLVFLAVIAFLGFDLPLAFERKAGRALPAVLMILVAFIVFTWGGLLVETPETLTKTFVPHLLVAKKVLGHGGRAVMGGVIVLGTFSALFAFFRIAGERVKGIVADEYSSHATMGAAVVMAVVIGVLLATGWAGEDALESLISAGLCFWFGTYALIDLLCLIGVRRAGGGIAGLGLGLVAMSLHAAAAAMSAMHIEFPSLFYYSLGGMAVAGIVLGFGYYRDMAPVKEIDESQESESGEIVEQEDESQDESLNIVDYS